MQAQAEAEQEALDVKVMTQALRSHRPSSTGASVRRCSMNGRWAQGVRSGAPRLHAWRCLWAAGRAVGGVAGPA